MPRLRRRARTCASVGTACSRTRGSPRRTSTARTTITRHRPKQCRRQGRAGVAARSPDGNTARWHDHRAHFMGTDDPPAGRAPPRPATGRRPLRDRRCASAASQVVAHGQHRLRATAVAVAVGRRRGRCSPASCSRSPARSAWRVVFVGRAGAAHRDRGRCTSSGSGTHRPRPFGTKLGESAYSIAGIALGLLALGWIWRKGAESAVPLVLVAAIFLFVAGGLADVTTLGNSQVPSTLPAGVARLLVTLTLGLGAGLRGRPRVPPASARTGSTRRRSHDRRRARRAVRPSPVELGAPRVVVRLDLDGGVRRSRARGAGPGPGRAPPCASVPVCEIITCSAGDVHLRRQRPHVQVVHVDDAREREELARIASRSRSRGATCSSTRSALGREPPRPRQDPHADDRGDDRVDRIPTRGRDHHRGDDDADRSGGVGHRVDVGARAPRGCPARRCAA